jgi:hypothetical protein
MSQQQCVRDLERWAVSMLMNDVFILVRASTSKTWQNCLSPDYYVLTHRLKFVAKSSSPSVMNLSNALMRDIGLQQGAQNSFTFTKLCTKTHCWLLLHDRQRPSHPLFCMGVASYWRPRSWRPRIWRPKDVKFKGVYGILWGKWLEEATNTIARILNLSTIHEYLHILSKFLCYVLLCRVVLLW